MCRSIYRYDISFIIAWMLGASIALSQSTPPERLAVPKSLEQIKVDKQLREKYKSQFTSRDAADRLALATTLRESAAQEKDPTARYVMLLRARDMFISAGDMPTCLAVIDEIAKSYTLNDAEMKGSALTSAIDLALIPPGDLARSYLKVADDALAEWNLDIARKAAYLGHKIARGNRELLAQLDDRDHTARIRNQAVIKFNEAARKLQKDPDDPQVNLIIGRHLCFNMNRWADGLPFLAKCAPGPLKDLAQRDLANPADPPAMAALADAWWTFTDPKNEIPPGAARRRAAYWYAKALPGLSGELKAEAEKRSSEKNATQ